MHTLVDLANLILAIYTELEKIENLSNKIYNIRNTFQLTTFLKEREIRDKYLFKLIDEYGTYNVINSTLEDRVNAVYETFDFRLQINSYFLTH